MKAVIKKEKGNNGIVFNIIHLEKLWIDNMKEPQSENRD